MSAPAPQMSSTGSAGITLNDDEDTFERDLKEMLKEGPSLNDMSSTVQVKMKHTLFYGQWMDRYNWTYFTAIKCTGSNWASLLCQW